jgi:hypothetical protein
MGIVEVNTPGATDKNSAHVANKHLRRNIHGLEQTESK